MNIVLIGPRGSGKTTLGKLLSARLGRPFVDLDERVLADLGRATVHEVWAGCGEPVWREAEAAALARTLQAGGKVGAGGRTGQVIALGGGTPMIPAARDLLERARATRAALMIYLHCSAATLARRLRKAPGDRPSLTGRAAADEIAAIVVQREPTYRALADIVCDMEHASAEVACASIIDSIEKIG